MRATTVGVRWARTRGPRLVADLARDGFPIAVAALVIANIALLWIGFTHSPVDVDEGFGLSIVHNLVSGAGYASDGIDNARALEPFDARASTGPVVLLPAAAIHALGVDIVTSGRIVGTLYYLLLVGALWVLGGWIAGRWGSIVAATGPMLLDTFTFDESPIYGPNDMLGEYPVAALVAVAIVVVRRRPMLAALLMGLAIQAKVIAIFLIPALVVAYLITHAAQPRKRTLRSLSAAAAVTLAPTIVFELVKAVMLGPATYILRLREFKGLLAVNRSTELYFVQKSQTLAGSWFLPTAVAVTLAACATALLVTALVRAARDRGGVVRMVRGLSENDAAWPGVVGILAGLTLLIQWFLTKNTWPFWIRHPSPGLLIGVSLGLASLLLAARSLEVRPRVPSGLIRLPVAGVLVLTLPLQVADHIYQATFEQRYGTLPQQRAVAQLIRDTGVDAVQGYWGAMIPIAAEAGVSTYEIGFAEDPATLVVLDDFPRPNFSGRYYGLGPLLCGEVLLTGPAVVCWPKK